MKDFDFDLEVQPIAPADRPEDVEGWAVLIIQGGRETARSDLFESREGAKSCLGFAAALLLTFTPAEAYLDGKRIAST